MKTIEIIEQKEEDDVKVKMTKEEVLDYIVKHGCYNFLNNYSVTEDFILENRQYFDKQVLLLSSLRLSESFIRTAIECGYFETDDIKEMNAVTYSGLSPEFVSEHGEFINWGRMLMYMSTQLDNFDGYVKIIEDENLWDLISANDLPIDFIREWKHKLDWKFLSMVKDFTDEEKSEFSDYIVIPDGVVAEEPFVSTDGLGFLDRMSDEELEDLIIKINKSINDHRDTL